MQLNLKSGLLNIIAVPFTDIALLLIMLIGLFRLRGYGASTFGMTKVLWRQVCYVFLLATTLTIHEYVFLLKGCLLALGRYCS